MTVRRTSHKKVGICRRSSEHKEEQTNLIFSLLIFDLHVGLRKELLESTLVTVRELDPLFGRINLGNHMKEIFKKGSRIDEKGNYDRNAWDGTLKV